MSHHAPDSRQRAGTAESPPARGGLGWWTDRLRSSPTGIAGVVIVTVFVATAIFAPVLATHDPNQGNLLMRFQPPMWAQQQPTGHLLGTDQLGRDLFSRIVYGTRVSLIVGLATMVIAAAVGIILGLVSGYLGGWPEVAIMRLVDAIIAIPNLLLYLTMIGVFGPNLLVLIAVLGLLGWTTYARVVRGEVLVIKEREHVAAARALGQADLLIVVRHILPHAMASVVILGTLQIATTIVTESGLSFLGLGVQPPTVTWGRMLADGRNYVATAWWIATFPGVAISIAVLGFIFLGDWLRDVLDPRLRR
jgi:peptide/nickel transport system permease protein